MMNKNDMPIKNIALDTIAAKKVAMKKGVKSYIKATPLKDKTGGSLGTIWTGPANEDPGVVKAKADKAKAKANLTNYNKKSKDMSIK